MLVVMSFAAFPLFSMFCFCIISRPLKTIFGTEQQMHCRKGRTKCVFYGQGWLASKWMLVNWKSVGGSRYLLVLPNPPSISLWRGSWSSGRSFSSPVGPHLTFLKTRRKRTTSNSTSGGSLSWTAVMNSSQNIWVSPAAFLHFLQLEWQVA